MRGRVVAQGFTVLVICIGGFVGFKPHNRPKTFEDKLLGEFQTEGSKNDNGGN